MQEPFPARQFRQYNQQFGKRQKKSRQQKLMGSVNKQLALSSDALVKEDSSLLHL